MIIALYGYATVGKDEVGKILVEECGFTRLAFADKLKECMSILNPIVDCHPFSEQGAVGISKVRLNDMKEKTPEVRRLYQIFGTEVGRQLLGENIWVDALVKQIKPRTDYVITDLRFPNEYEAMKNLGAVFCHVVRPDVPILNHESEKYIPTFKPDICLHNTTTLEDLKQNTLTFLESL